MKGFTLVEMMVSVAIFGVLFVALFSVLSSGNNIFQRDSVYLDLQQGVRNGMDRMVREIRESKTSTVTVISDDLDTILFNTPNETGIQYYVTNSQLIREYPAGTAQAVAQNIGGLKFTKSGKLMLIDLRGQGTQQGGTFVFSLREAVRLRNE